MKNKLWIPTTTYNGHMLDVAGTYSCNLFLKALAFTSIYIYFPPHKLDLRFLRSLHTAVVHSYNLDNNKSSAPFKLTPTPKLSMHLKG